MYAVPPPLKWMLSPRRGDAYQPWATPWVLGVMQFYVLKERRISFGVQLFEFFLPYDKELLMPQSLSLILLHVVWSTKDRQPWLQSGIRERTHAFLAGAVRTCDCEAYRVGGMADHVHLAVRLSRTLAVADLVKTVKTASSKWLKEQDAALSDFSWQQGYGIFSVGMSQKDALLHYIDAQEEHHRTLTFQDEYLAFLAKYGIAHDERYVWD